MDGFAFLPRDHGWLFGMTYLAETAMLIGDARRAAEIEQRLAPYGDRMGFARERSAPDRSTVFAGSSPRSRDGTTRRSSFSRTLSAMRSGWGRGLWAVRSNVDRARVLVQRHRPGDRALARELVEAHWRRVGPLAFGDRAGGSGGRGVAGHGGVGRVRTSRSSDAPHGHVPARRRRVVDRRRADRPASAQQRPLYLSRLIAKPGREIHALDLCRTGSRGG